MKRFVFVAGVLAFVVLSIIFRSDIYRMLGITDIVPVKTGQSGLYVLDTGQAQSVIVKTDNASVLIDTAGYDDASEIIFAADMLKIDKFDAVIISHMHYDHAGGLSGVLENKGTDALYMDNAAASSAGYDKSTYKTLNEIDDGESVSVGDIDIEFMLCEDAEDENESSVVCRVKAESMSAMICGDIGFKSEEKLMDEYGDISSDILIAAHHGSANSTGDSFLRKVSPKTVIVSAGKDNAYSLPSEKFLKRVENYGAALFRTDIHSDISVINDGETYCVYTSE